MVIGIAVGVIAVALLAAQGHLRMSLPDPTVQLKGDSAQFPMTLVDGRPVVQLRINGEGPFPFILDSGAEGTILSRELAASLKLPMLGHARVGSPGGQEPKDAELVRFDRAELGGLAFSEMGAVAVDLSSMPAVFSGPGAPVGALSFRNWKGMLVTLDYPGSRIEVRRGEIAKADDQETFAFSSGDKLPSVPIRIGDTSLRANLDSGAARGVVMPRQFENKLPLVAAAVPVESLRTMGGVANATAARLKGDIRIGRYSIDSPEVNFVDNFPVINFGYPVLQRFAVTLDWQNHTVRLSERPTNPS